MAGALDGVKCLVVIMFQQLPVAFSMMCDMGASVVKIEPPKTGELGRRLLAKEDFPLSPYFETNNRGFKCITCNLKTPEGLEILKKIVKDVDVFAQNFRPGVAERLGFSYDDLVKINPGIIYLSASAYGPDGPSAKLPGTDAVAQAAGGISTAYGAAGTPITTGQVAIADETSANYNLQAILAALYHKAKTGEGQKIETSLVGGQIRLMGFSMTNVCWGYPENSRDRCRLMSGRAPAITASFYDKDGRPFVAQVVGEDRWQKGMDAAGFGKMLEEAGCASLGEVANDPAKKDVFLKTMDKLFATDAREHWIEILRAADVVCAPINTLKEASEDPDVIANEYVTFVDHPKVGRIKEVGFPWKFSKTPAKAGIAPGLGEHNEEILKGLGYSDAQIKELEEKGVL